MIYSGRSNGADSERAGVLLVGAGLMIATSGRTDDPLEIMGVGFGPANLALAAAIHEFPLVKGVSLADRTSFFEQQPGFSWHQGMLIEGATMQVSFLKDLVTLRNPVSEFSFVNFLHTQDRLTDFINNKIIYP